MINWKQNWEKKNKTKTQTRKCSVQRTLYLRVTLLWQQWYGFGLEARSISGYVVRVCIFVFNILLPPMALNNQSFPIYHHFHCNAPLYLLTALTATRHYSSIDLFSFLFSQFRPRDVLQGNCLLSFHKSCIPFAGKHTYIRQSGVPSHGLKWENKKGKRKQNRCSCCRRWRVWCNVFSV